MKKITALILSAIMLLCVCSPAFAVNENEEKYPVIYIAGQGVSIVRNQGQADEKKLYPFEKDILDDIIENIKPLLENAALGVVKNDYSEYTEQITNLFREKYSELKLGKDGLPTDGSTMYRGSKWRDGGKLSNLVETIPMGDESRYPVYRYHYDWRLSPVLIAEDLNDLVDTVLEQTGAKKVNIISRCQGTCVLFAYICNEAFGAKEKVNSCVFYDSAFRGIGAVDAMFSGKLVIDAGAVDRFLSFYLDKENITLNDENTTELILAFAELMEELEVLGFGLDKLTPVINDIAADALPGVLKESFGTFLGYWAMLSPEYYEQAIDFIFPTEEDKAEWAGLIAQADEFYALQKNMDERFKELSEYIDIGVVAKYGFPAYPISADGAEESDGYVSARKTGFGAEVTDLDKKFSGAYISKATLDGTAKYISADRQIDASKGLFPEKTWFIKNLYHTPFPSCVNDLMIEFVNSNGKMTVWSDPDFTQYLQFTPTNDRTSDAARGFLTPINTMSDTVDLTEKYTHSKLEALFKFVLKFFKMIIALFKGGTAAE